MNKGPFMEFMKCEVQPDADETYHETEFPTPASKSSNLAMLIHQIKYQFGDQNGHAEDDEQILDVHDTKGVTDELLISDPRCIDMHNYQMKITTDGSTVVTLLHTEYFDPPLLYSKSNIYIGYKTNGMAQQNTGAVRIGYTLEQVSKDAYIDALVE